MVLTGEEDSDKEEHKGGASWAAVNKLFLDLDSDYRNMFGL